VGVGAGAGEPAQVFGGEKGPFFAGQQPCKD